VRRAAAQDPAQHIAAFSIASPTATSGRSVTAGEWRQAATAARAGASLTASIASGLACGRHSTSWPPRQSGQPRQDLRTVFEALLLRSHSAMARIAFSSALARGPVISPLLVAPPGKWMVHVH
jgi:hypothetical protein